MGNIFGVAKKGFGMLKKAKGGAVKKPGTGGYAPTLPSVTTDVHERRKNPNPQQQQYTTDVHERRKRREEWRKSLRPQYPSSGGPGGPGKKLEEDKPKTGRPGSRKKSGPHDRHPPKTKRKSPGPPAGRPPKKRPRPMSTS